MTEQTPSPDALAAIPLRNCPFCGSDDIRRDHPSRAPRVYCSNCRSCSEDPRIWNGDLRANPTVQPAQVVEAVANAGKLNSCPSCGALPCYWLNDPPIAAMPIVTDEVERLREALDIAWQAASKMRNASKLVGPYPNDHKLTKIWVRSLYHEGKDLMQKLKPYRLSAAIGGK